jgi:hypothetical protein
LTPHRDGAAQAKPRRFTRGGMKNIDQFSRLPQNYGVHRLVKAQAGRQ